MVHNKYFWFNKVLSPKQWQDIINLGLSQIKKSKEDGIDVSGTTAGDKHKQEADKKNAVAQNDKDFEDLKSENIDVNNSYVRDSEVTWLDDDWIYDIIMPYVNRANTSAGWNFDIDFGEKFQFTVYKPGGFYGWHSDSGMCNFSKYKRIIPGITEKDENGKYPPQYISSDQNNRIGKVRKLSATINLTEPEQYKGGNLKFDFGPHSDGERYHECIEIRPQGSMVVFPSFVHHQVTPVDVGIRYSLVLWSLGKPFR